MLSTNRQSNRVFRLLRGMSAAPVLALLRPRGCNEEVLAQGWDLLRRANGVRLVKPRGGLSSVPASERLEALQAAWFPVADATLEERFPSVHETLFRNLGRGSGPDLYVAMQTFRDRVGVIFASENATDAEASKLLQFRGLTAAVLAEIDGELQHFKMLELADDSIDTQPVAKAEKDLSVFYNEWSKIVRATVKDRRLLLAMGFLRKPRAPKAAKAVEGSTTAGAAKPAKNGAEAPKSTATVAVTNGVGQASTSTQPS